MNRTALLIVCCALVAIPVFAQKGPTCSPVGTWYGGSDLKYQLTITYNGANKYTVTGDAGFLAPGFAATTKSTGIMVRKGHTFVSNAITLMNPDGSFPPQPPQIWAIQVTTEMPDCNTLKNTITFFAAYFWGKTPLVSDPDYYPAPTPIYETYYRLVEP